MVINLNFSNYIISESHETKNNTSDNFNKIILEPKYQLAMKKIISITFFLFIYVQLFAQVPKGFATFEPIINEMPRPQKNATKYTQSCVVKYLTEDGWSKKYTVDVTFISGYRLNEATQSSNYSTFSKYAVIFWAENQSSVIKLSTFLPCDTDVYRECVVNVIGDIRGQDQEERDWKICVGNFCN